MQVVSWMSFANKIREAIKVDKIKNYCKYPINTLPLDGSSFLIIFKIFFGMKISIHFPFSTLMASLSDPAVGGTFLSLLSAFSNLGWLWPKPLALWLVDQTTVRSVC